MDTGTQEQQYTLDNFKEKTGKRFRLTKDQTARIKLSALNAEDRTSVASMSVEDAATYFKAFNKKQKPLGWVERAVELAQNWQDDMTLTREQAFADFLAEGGPKRLKEPKKEVPLSVWLDPNLTVDNFGEKVFAVTGEKNHRFRRNKAQIERGLSREDALVETVEEKRAKVAQETETGEMS